MRVLWRRVFWTALLVAPPVGCLGGQTGDAGQPTPGAGECVGAEKILSLAAASSAGWLPGDWLAAASAGSPVEIEVIAPASLWAALEIESPEGGVGTAVLTLQTTGRVFVRDVAFDPAAWLARCPNSARVELAASVAFPMIADVIHGEGWHSPVPQGSGSLDLATLGRCALTLGETGTPQTLTCPTPRAHSTGER